MTKEQFQRIIDLLDEPIMRKIQRNYSVSIDEEEEVERACEKVLGRKANDDEFNNNTLFYFLSRNYPIIIYILYGVKITIFIISTTSKLNTENEFLIPTV